MEYDNGKRIGEWVSRNEKGEENYDQRLVENQQDIRAGIRYFRRYHEQYGIDPDLIFSGGWSSGAFGARMQGYISRDELTDKELASVLSHNARRKCRWMRK